MASKPTITQYGIQAGTERTCFVKWNWSKASQTDVYKVVWYYVAGGTSFLGEIDEVEGSATKQSLYDAPYNATSVKVKILPVAKTHTVKKKLVRYWVAGYSTLVTIRTSETPTPQTPPVPTVSISGYKLTASVNNLQSSNATHVQFHIVNGSKTYKTINAKISAWAASCSCTVPAGGEFRVRARTFKTEGGGTTFSFVYSSYSEYSGYSYTPPPTPAGYATYKATSTDSVYIDFKNSAGATSYTVEYTDNKDYFDSNPQGVRRTTVNTGHAEISGLESGKRWYFRVQASNNYGSSGWAKIIDILLGSAPEAPTVWSFQSYVNPETSTTIYWTHNTVDGSDQTGAQVNFRDKSQPASTAQTITINGDQTSYAFDNSSYTDGTQIIYRVRTKGVYTGGDNNGYGDYSTATYYTVIQPTTASIQCDSEVTSYPFTVTVAGDPLTHVLGYTINITSLTDYDGLDEYGNNLHVSAGQEVYNEYFPSVGAELEFNLPFLENNADYKIAATVTSIYGEAVQDDVDITVALADVDYDIDAEILVDDEALTASIHPYCTDANGDVLGGIMLSVYRREYDGSLVPIQENIESDSGQFITDPHPSLDFARYRIVAVAENTGIINFSDVPGVPVGEESVVIQWDESWVPFDATDEDETEQPSWSGSIIKLGYDINISEEYTKDSENVKYIGRTDPIAYYGTNMDTKSTWSAAIITIDPDLLYQLRRLANYRGNVYVREPSGAGYWANVNVDIQKQEIAPVARVTLDVVKVEGGA